MLHPQPFGIVFLSFFENKQKANSMCEGCVMKQNKSASVDVYRVFVMFSRCCRHISVRGLVARGPRDAKDVGICCYVTSADISAHDKQHK